ncbi:MAG: hypothetical protein ACK5KV_03010 [Bacteroides graminisolvens]|uniref:hypothetical protein n=1 Tax=Bacteroides graminisolvens TaxID=477666 RepID=UPI003A876781
MKSKMLLPLLLIGGVVVAFYLGFKSKESEKEIAAYAFDKGVGIASDVVKTQATETQKWFNQLTNTWKQIWKK